MIRRSRFLVLLLVFTAIGLAWPSDAAAQRRAPPGRAVGQAVPRTYAPRYYRPYYPRYNYPYAYGRYYYPYAYRGYYAPYYGFYPGFSFSFGFGYGWPAAYWGGYGYPYGYRYGYGYPYAYPYPYYYDNMGSARLQITPRNAEVYVDGQFAGIVDQFDGSFQRLNVENGRHEIQIHLDGYRPLTQNVLFTRGTTVRIEAALQPLSPGEQTAPRPQAPATRQPRQPDSYERERPAPSYRGGEPAPAGYGSLSVRVTPSDAVILIDGEVWDRPAGDSRFTIDLAEGPHRVDVRKEGFASYTRTVDILSGRPFTLNVSLTPRGPGSVPGAPGGNVRGTTTGQRTAVRVVGPVR
jgi:hypothetical protein